MCSSHPVRVVSLTSRQVLQDSVHAMELSEQRVLAQKGLVDSESRCLSFNAISPSLVWIGVKSITDGVSNIDLAMNLTATTVSDTQKRLETALDDLEKPMVRVVNQLSDLCRALKGTCFQFPQFCHH